MRGLTGRRIIQALVAGGITALLVGPMPSAPALVPGASGRIVFVSDRDGNNEIYTMSADGSNQRRLTNTVADDQNPRWSPDGTKIAFQSNRSGSTQIFTMNADGSNPRQITNIADVAEFPSWSPDGTKIAFDAGANVSPIFPFTNRSIYIANADGSDATQVTTRLSPSTTDQQPVWSAGDNRIALYSNRDDNLNVYSMKPDGSDLRRLTSDAATDWFPYWSPDGTEIAFGSDRTGTNQIYVMTAAGVGQTRITHDSAQDNQPSWSPDGRRIAFNSNRSGNWEIYAMNPNGTGLLRLTNNAALDAQPDWQAGPTTTSCPRPTIKGKARVGRKLYVVQATPTPSGATARYQWLRRHKAIKHARKASYKLTAKDRGKKVSVRVTCSFPDRLAVSVTSKSRKIR